MSRCRKALEILTKSFASLELHDQVAMALGRPVALGTAGISPALLDRRSRCDIANS